MTPRPSRHALVSSLVIFGLIMLIGSWHDPGQALAMAVLFVGLPWFVYYFLVWLGDWPYTHQAREQEDFWWGDFPE